MGPSQTITPAAWKVEVWMFATDGDMFLKTIKKRGFTQASLARTVRKSPAHISLLISGKRAASPNVAHLIAEALEVPMDLIFTTKASRIPMRIATKPSQKRAA